MSVILFESEVDGSVITLPERKYDCGIPTGKGLAPEFSYSDRTYVIVPKGCEDCTDEDGAPKYEFRNIALKQHPTYEDTAYGCRIVTPADKPKWEWVKVDCNCTAYARTIVDGKAYDVPVPELVQTVEDESEPVYITDHLVSYESDTRAKSLALEDVGFQYKDMVYVDGQPMGVIDFGDTDAQALLKEVCPTINFRYNPTTGNPGAYCKCGWKALYRNYIAADEEFIALSGGFADEVNAGDFQSPHMRAYVADVVHHAATAHPGLTADDFCEHGQRRFVAKKERPSTKTVWVTIGWNEDTDAPVQEKRIIVDEKAPKKQGFKAYFCPKGKCDPIWDNS